MAPAYAADPTCQGRPATIVATADQQNLLGTDGADVVVVGAFDWVTVDGRGGDDVLCATEGHGSVLDGGTGNDILVDQDEGVVEPSTRTTLVGRSSGDDQFFGGPDTNLSFASSPVALTIDLAAGTATHAEGTDSITGIHRVVGSNGADTFRGSPGDDYYESDPALIDSTAGDQVSTGAGDDWVQARWATVDLGPGDDDGHIEGGTLAGGEGNDLLGVAEEGTANGGPGRDRLGAGVSESLRNKQHSIVLDGGSGDDILRMPRAYSELGAWACPRLCAASTLKGGSGSDRLVLDMPRAVVDLGTGRARVKSGRAALASIENVQGTLWADVIKGDGHANRLAGFGGDDVLIGRSGPDRLIGGCRPGPRRRRPRSRPVHRGAEVVVLSG